jgi:ribosomal protein S18 acetylase RimI-like enzyme
MEHRSLSPFVELVRSNALATYLGLVASVEGSQVTRCQGYTLVEGQGPFSFCNFAAGFALECADVGAVVESLRNHAEGRFGFYVFVMSGDEPGDLDSHLVRAGFEHRQRLVSMASTQVCTAEPVEAQLVANLEDRRSIAAFMARQFFWTMPDQAKEAIAAATAASGHTIWRVGGASEPEAAVMLVEQPDCVGLFNLCVRPELRSRGLGRSLVKAVQSASKLSGRPVVLQCSDDLTGWYSDLGFERVGHILALTLAGPTSGDILL